MAILTVEERVEIRHRVANEVPINFVKAQANTVSQAIEDWFESVRPGLIGAINTATAPLVLTPAQKVAFVKSWLQSKLERGGA